MRMHTAFGTYLVGVAVLLATSVMWHSPPLYAQDFPDPIVIQVNDYETREDFTLILDTLTQYAAAATALVALATDTADTATVAVLAAEMQAEEALDLAEEAEDAVKDARGTDAEKVAVKAARNSVKKLAKDAKDAVKSARRAVTATTKAVTAATRAMTGKTPSSDSVSYYIAAIEARLSLFVDTSLEILRELLTSAVEQANTARRQAQTAQTQSLTAAAAAQEAVLFAQGAAEAAVLATALAVDATTAALAVATALAAEAAAGRAAAPTDPAAITADVRAASALREAAAEAAAAVAAALAAKETAGSSADTGAGAGLRRGLAVTPRGVGDLLIFGYWTTEADRNTLLSLKNVDGHTTQQRSVSITIHDMTGAELSSFTICLDPGDVWAAALVPDKQNQNGSQIRIDDPGSCDDANGTSPPPAADAVLALAARYGYAQIYTEDNSDTLAGTATVLSAAGNFSARYNATTLTGHVAGTTTTADIASALAAEGGDAATTKNVLLGRWTAAADLDASTQVVLTFPTGGSSDPVSIWAYDAAGQSVFTRHESSLDQAVNVCTFRNTLHTDSGMTELVCNDNDGLVIGPDGGWFRIVNNQDGAELHGASAQPVSSFPVIGLVFSFFAGSTGDSDQVQPVQWTGTAPALPLMRMDMDN